MIIIHTRFRLLSTRRLYAFIVPVTTTRRHAHMVDTYIPRPQYRGHILEPVSLGLVLEPSSHTLTNAHINTLKSTHTLSHSVHNIYINIRAHISGCRFPEYRWLGIRDDNVYNNDNLLFLCRRMYLCYIINVRLFLSCHSPSLR